MKTYTKIAIVLSIPFMIGVAQADTAAVAGSQSGSLAGAQAGSQAGSNSGVTLNQTSISPPVNLSHAVGAAYAPALTTTLTGTCMGSTSAGAGFAGGAFSIGSTWQDDNCNLRQYANALVAIGDLPAARAVLCQSDEVRQAYQLTSTPCPQDNPGVNAEKLRAESQQKMLKLQKEFDARYHVSK
jgi:hypothetical protein